VLASIAQRLTVTVLFLLAACFVGKSSATEPLSAQNRQQASLAVMRTVEGILSFSRWPEAHEVLNLCIAGDVRFADFLLSERLHKAGVQTLHIRRYTQEADMPPPLDCNVLYLGRLSTALQSEIFARFMGMPTLLISEVDDDCAVGNMFCLMVGERQVNFAVNLDSLSRSQVRVHPNVLKLAKGKP